MNKSNLIPTTVADVSDPKIAACNDFGKRKINYKTGATKQEIQAALKLIELLFIKGHIPKHVYRNIFSEYYGKGLDITSGACYTFNTARDAV